MSLLGTSSFVPRAIWTKIVTSFANKCLLQIKISFNYPNTLIKKDARDQRKMLFNERPVLRCLFTCNQFMLLFQFFDQNDPFGFHFIQGLGGRVRSHAFG